MRVRRDPIWTKWVYAMGALKELCATSLASWRHSSLNLATSVLRESHKRCIYARWVKLRAQGVHRLAKSFASKVTKGLYATCQYATYVCVL